MNKMLEAISFGQTIAISGHTKPDGDCFGSATAAVETTNCNNYGQVYTSAGNNGSSHSIGGIVGYSVQPTIAGFGGGNITESTIEPKTPNARLANRWQPHIGLYLARISNHTQIHKSIIKIRFIHKFLSEIISYSM